MPTWKWARPISRYEDVKAAADENGRTVAETLDIIERTVAKDRGEHAGEYTPAD